MKILIVVKSVMVLHLYSSSIVYLLQIQIYE